MILQALLSIPSIQMESHLWRRPEKSKNLRMPSLTFWQDRCSISRSIFTLASLIRVGRPTVSQVTWIHILKGPTWRTHSLWCTTASSLTTETWRLSSKSAAMSSRVKPIRRLWQNSFITCTCNIRTTRLENWSSRWSSKWWVAKWTWLESQKKNSSNSIVFRIHFRKEHSLWRSSPNISPANVSQHVAVHHFLLESKRKLVLPLIIFQSCMAKVNIHDDKRHVFISRDRERERNDDWRRLQFNALIDEPLMCDVDVRSQSRNSLGSFVYVSCIWVECCASGLNDSIS